MILKYLYFLRPLEYIYHICKFYVCMKVCMWVNTIASKWCIRLSWILVCRVSPKQFQKGAAPCLPFHRMNSALVALHSKIAPFLPFSKKWEKGCLFMMFIYILNMSYTFKLKSAFGNQKCALKNIKSAPFLFSAPCPFFSLRETL